MSELMLIVESRLEHHTAMNIPTVLITVCCKEYHPRIPYLLERGRVKAL